MEYLEIRFDAVGDDQAREWLIATLAEAGFDSFADQDEALLAYIPRGKYSVSLLKELHLEEIWPSVTYEVNELSDINWNSEWEKNYPPVVIADRCYIRAPFHPERKDYPLEIIIEPRMAFGTAHHETTALMIEWILSMDLQGKDVLDMGCGSGVLAILANKCGARFVTAIDNDDWAYQNALDNFRINGVSDGKVMKGDAGLLDHGLYDVILANINRNILTEDMPSYAGALRKGGSLVVSGFYESDLEAVEKSAGDQGLLLSGKRINNSWVAAMFCT